MVMRQTNFLGKIRLIMKVVLHYFSQHYASLENLDRPYSRTWEDPYQKGKLISTSISFTPYGSLYKVYEVTYNDGRLIKEETRLATYGWHSNGHLIEIGGYRYWIFDSMGKSLYVEDYNEQDVKSFEVYIRM
jgi:hypothetical protein